MLPAIIKETVYDTESSVQHGIVDKCYPVIVLLVSLNGIDLPYSCVTVLLVLPHGKVLHSDKVILCHIVALAMLYYTVSLVTQ